MMKTTAILMLAAMAAGLSACDDAHEHMVNTKICAVWKAPATTATAPGVGGAALTDASSPVDTCVKRWAYSLAGARDSADVVADAAVAACGAALSTWNQSSLGVDSQQGPVQSMSITTGQPTNALAEHTNFAHTQALLYVVEARAGRCKPPAVVNGEPVGG